MSHIPERKERDCLNCGTIVQGKYCHVCGQENTVPHESFGHMVKHFFYDIFHFDSKFFDTAKDLLFRPGFLSKEYVKGRRASYLHPIKMYVFTSAIFFLIFFSVIKPSSGLQTSVSDTLSTDGREKAIKMVAEKVKTDTSAQQRELLRLLQDSTRKVTVDEYARMGGKLSFIGFSFTGATSEFETVHEYDSFQKALPKNERDGFLERIIKKKEIGISEKYSENPEAGIMVILNGFLHKLPYLLFISLPLFALFLKLLYIRRKEFYYFDHGIFTLHHYIFCFILLLIVFVMQGLSNWLGWGFFDIIATILFLSGGLYLYKAMRNFYRQRRAKTILKFILLNIMGFVSLVFLFLVFVLLSIFDL